VAGKEHREAAIPAEVAVVVVSLGCSDVSAGVVVWVGLRGVESSSNKVAKTISAW
jgi:hypothetical protein